MPVAAQEQSMLEHALQFARWAWPVAPAHSIANGYCTCGDRECSSPGKHPRTEHGFEDASLEDGKIRGWWARWPDANILVRTGVVGDRCLVVLDVDPRHGGNEALEELLEEHGPLPKTLVARTGSGGQHWFFWSRTIVGSSANRVGRGLDVRGEGGYVIGVGSRHISGESYSWQVGPDEAILEEAPEWFVKRAVKGQRKRDQTAPPSYIKGGRNVALASMAGSMRRRGMSREAIEAALTIESDLKCEPPLDPKEIGKIAASYAKYEPTDVPEPNALDRKAATFTDIVAKWKAQGPVKRARTGWPAFDEAARGGLAFGRRTFLAGAPNAGKTAAAAVLAHRYWQDGYVVGILAVDEEPDDVTARFAQMAGFTLEDTETGDEMKLDAIGAALARSGVYLYDSRWSIEAAAADLAAHAGEKPAVFIVDSVQTVRCAESMKADNPRLVVGANVRALKHVTSEHRFLLIATSELPRGAYRNEDAARDFNDMAAGKDSGDIEYAAAVQMVLRSVKDHPGLIRVNVPKLKRGREVEFYLRLNRVTHTLVEADAPVAAETPNKTATSRKRTVEDAKALRELLLRKPGLGTKEMRAEWARLGYGGKDRLEVALAELGAEVAKIEMGRGKIEHRIVMAGGHGG